MTNRLRQRLCGVGLAALAALATPPACRGEDRTMGITQRLQDFSPTVTPAADVGLGDFALGARVAALLATPTPPDWRSTTVGRGSYLDLMERIVTVAAGWVDDQGRVIDPVVKQDRGQTTPRFAAPGAILLHFGRAPQVRDAVYRVMDYCCQALPAGQARQNSPDFWMRELATAYLALEGVAEPARRARWAAGLAAVEPEKTYTAVRPDGTGLDKLGNWVIYAAGGEAMREAAGLVPVPGVLWGRAFFDKYVVAQLGCFTDCGMYRDPGDPFTYDVTTRLQVACGLAFGYRGPHRAALDERLRRGGLTTLLFTAPEGFCPFGGRSAAFNFREVILTALCELEARRYRTSDPRLAGAFKRQAHLSFLSVRRWLADMTPWRHLKNGFPPDARHGLDAYGNYGVYSLLAASFLGLAAVFADDTIPEAPCPAELGGFVLELTPAFHKVLANCQGTYLELDTAADPHYDATGLGCFTRAGVPLELGLGMPFPAPRQKWGNAAITMGPGCHQPAAPVAIGSQWRVGDAWVSLAGLTDGLTHAVKVRQETPQAVAFEVAYASGATSVVEAYVLTRGQVAITSRVQVGGRPAPLRFVVPLLVTDGDARATVHGPADGAATVTYREHSYTVRFGPDVRAELGDDQYANRNGVYRSLVLTPAANEIQVTLALR